MRDGVQNAGRSRHASALSSRGRAGERRPRHVLVRVRRDRRAARRVLLAGTGAGHDRHDAARANAVSARRSGARRVSRHGARLGRPVSDRRRLSGRHARARRALRRGNRDAVDQGRGPPRSARQVRRRVGADTRARQRDRVGPLAVHGFGRRVRAVRRTRAAALSADLRDDRAPGERPRDRRVPDRRGAAAAAAEGGSAGAPAQRAPSGVPADRRRRHARDRRRRSAAALAASEVGGHQPGRVRPARRIECAAAAGDRVRAAHRGVRTHRARALPADAHRDQRRAEGSRAAAIRVRGRRRDPPASARIHAGARSDRALPARKESAHDRDLHDAARERREVRDRRLRHAPQQSRHAVAPVALTLAHSASRTICTVLRMVVGIVGSSRRVAGRRSLFVVRCSLLPIRRPSVCPRVSSAIRTRGIAAPAAQSSAIGAASTTAASGRCPSRSEIARPAAFSSAT